MSRTYRNAIRRGNCVGSNTTYYRQRRRCYRVMLRNALVRAMRCEEPDEVFIHPEYRIPFIDRNSEPTDGHCLIDRSYTNPRSIEIDLKDDYFDEEWLYHCIRKWYSKLKPKHIRYAS